MPEFARFVQSPDVRPSAPPAPSLASPGNFFFNVDLGPGYAYSVVIGRLTLLSGRDPILEIGLTTYPYCGVTKTYPSASGVVMQVGVVAALPNSTLTIEITQESSLAAPDVTLLGVLVLGSTDTAIQIV